MGFPRGIEITVPNRAVLILRAGVVYHYVGGGHQRRNMIRKICC